MFPEHNDVEVQFYVDGKDAFEAMADALESATKEVLIGKWACLGQTEKGWGGGGGGVVFGGGGGGQTRACGN